MSSGRSSYLASFMDMSRPAPIIGGSASYRQVAQRLQREAAIVGKSMRNGIENRRVRQYLERLPDHIVGFENLRAALEDQAEHGGSAPGVDGISYANLAAGWENKPDAMKDRYKVLTPKEWFKTLRDLSWKCKAGEYAPAELREVRIKEGAKERILRLPTCQDRILERAILSVVSPLTDMYFDPDSYGFRPGRSTQNAHAAVSVIAEEETAWFWLKLDVRKAFDSIPKDAAVEAVRDLVQVEEVVELIEKIIRRPGTERANQDRGLHQGGPIIPWVANAFLDKIIDKPFRKAGLRAWLVRYADDLLVITQNISDLRAAEAFLKDALNPLGMSLKEEKREERNLTAGETVESYLGLDCFVEESTVLFDVPDDSWTDFKQRTNQIVNDDTLEPEQRESAAGNLLVGWLAFTAPTLGVSRTMTNSIPFEALSIQSNQLGRPDLWDIKSAVAQIYSHAIDEWRIRLRETRETYRLGRRAPPTH